LIAGEGRAAASLEVNKLSFRYGRRPLVLDDVSFGAHGGLNCVKGSNGSGKSTLLRLIATARIPAKHQILVDGVDLSERRQRAEIRARISYLPQVTRPDSGLTVRNWIEFGGWLQRLGGKHLEDLTSHALEEWMLGELSGRRLKDLSVGQRRRADLARACMNPQTTLLVVDEPFAALDHEFIGVAQRVMSDRASRATVLFSDPSPQWTAAQLVLEL